MLGILTSHLTAADGHFSTGAVAWLRKSGPVWGKLCLDQDTGLRYPRRQLANLSCRGFTCGDTLPVPSPVSSESRTGAYSPVSISWPTRIAEAVVGSLRQELPLASDARPHRKLAGVDLVLLQELLGEPEDPSVFHNGIAIETSLFELHQHRLSVAKEAIDDALNDFPREQGA